jgi:hypothetical protein
MVEDVPDFLISKQKLCGKDKIACLLCGQKKKKTLKDMPKHVGGHIPRDLHNCAAKNECKSHTIREN